MPVFTPSRIAVVVLSLSLLSFLWTFGLPHQLAQPALPIINHDDHPHGKPITEPLVPSPVISPPHTETQIPTPKKTHEAENNKDTTSSRPTEPDQDNHTKAAAPASSGAQDASVPPPPPPSSSSLPHPTGNSTATHKATTPSDTTSSSEAPSTPSAAPVIKFCKDVYGAPNVMVIVRTSKADIHKLPTHLQGLLSCVPNFTIFSDHSGEIDGHKIYNALDSITNTTKLAHDEFTEYEKIQIDNTHKPSPSSANNLDKWKFLPMVYKAYEMNPSAKFYIFIEPDTSLSWTNLLQWMARLDYRIPYYSGAPTVMGDVRFAQRGSGILLSNGAMRQYAKAYGERYISHWEPKVGKECCGDLVLATALKESRVEFYSSWPLIQSENPTSLDFSKKHWCVPAVSWHHVSNEEIDAIWNFNRNWTTKHGWEVPYLFKNAFEEFVQPHLEAVKKGWDNLSQDSKIVAPKGRKKQLQEEEDRRKQETVEQKADDKDEVPPLSPPAPVQPLETNPTLKAPAPAKPKDPSPGTESKSSKRGDEPVDWNKLGELIKDAADSAEHCKSTCAKVEDCVQWKYTPKGDGECHLNKVLRLGRKVEKKGDEDDWTSGWILDKVDKIKSEWECKEPIWKFNQ